MLRAKGGVVVGSTTEELDQGPERRLDGWGSHKTHLSKQNSASKIREKQ